jgi:hypothetical protein
VGDPSGAPTARTGNLASLGQQGTIRHNLMRELAALFKTARMRGSSGGILRIRVEALKAVGDGPYFS